MDEGRKRKKSETGGPDLVLPQMLGIPACKLHSLFHYFKTGLNMYLFSDCWVPFKKLVYVNCTKGFHCHISTYTMYLHQIYPLHYSFLSPLHPFQIVLMVFITLFLYICVKQFNHNYPSFNLFFYPP